MSSTQQYLQEQFASILNNPSKKDRSTFDYLGNLKKPVHVRIPPYQSKHNHLSKREEELPFLKPKNALKQSKSQIRNVYMSDNLIQDHLMKRKNVITEEDNRKDLIFLQRQRVLEKNKSVVPFLKEGLLRNADKGKEPSPVEIDESGKSSPPIQTNSVQAFLETENDKKDEELFKEIFGLSDSNIQKEIQLLQKEIEATEKNKKLEVLLVGHKPNFKADIKNNTMNDNTVITIDDEEEHDDNAQDKTNSLSSTNLAKLNPHINPLKRASSSQHYFKYFKFSKNEIYEKVLDFRFFRTSEKHSTVSIPDTFESEQHYKYVWITDFFYELKHCLLAEKGEKRERENYLNMDVAVNFFYNSEFDDKLLLFKMNTNKKLSDLKQKIFKENDIVAFYRSSSVIPYNEINFKNKSNLKYFIGIIQINEANEILCLVHRDTDKEFNLSSSSSFANNVASSALNVLYSSFYLGSLTSSLREYNAVLNLELSNFTGLLFTKELLSQPQMSNCSAPHQVRLFLENIKQSSIFNPSQTEAIIKASSMKIRDILLIQGPPGTGKTHTILGLVSLFLLNNDGRILICAPSNTAIDEIAARIATRGVFNEELQQVNPIFVRFGLYDRFEKEKKYLNSKNGRILQRYSLEKLSDDKFKGQVIDFNSRLDKIDYKLAEYKEKELKSTSSAEKNEIQFAVKELKTEKHFILLSLQDIKNNKKTYEYELLSKTRILCTTLNSSGSERLKKLKIAFDYLIIDEACQCVEPSALIPLSHNVKKLVMVGDHMQLPATVFSDNATVTKYNRSLFERLIDNNYPRYILTIQYRMHPHIRDFIGTIFYDSQLSDAPEAVERLTNSSFYSAVNHNRNFSFFDIEYGKEQFAQFKKSFMNTAETNFCIELIKEIHRKLTPRVSKAKHNEDYFSVSHSKEQLPTFHFALITPYKSQVMLLIDKVSKDKDLAMVDIEINTVDSFQGREQDVVIFSCVRANFGSNDAKMNDGEGEGEAQANDKEKEETVPAVSTSGIGFLNDYRRMNVALSRARLGCFIVGHAKTLVHNEYWKKLLQACIAKKSLFSFPNETTAYQSIPSVLFNYATSTNDNEDGEIIEECQDSMKDNSSNKMPTFLGRKRNSPSRLEEESHVKPKLE